MTSSAIPVAAASARPRCFVDGRAAPLLAAQMQAMVVEETTEGLSSCEITLGNWGGSSGGLGYLFTDRQLVDFGKPLRIAMGAGNVGGTVFDGAITGMEGRWSQERAPTLLVLAEDRLQDMRMTRRSRVFEQVSDADVMQRIASDHGLTPELDVTGPTYATLAQVNQSDLAFLRDRARAIDAELWVEGTTLHVQARSRRRTSTLRLAVQREIRQLALMADLAGQSTSLTVSGWDRGAKAMVSYEATDSALGGERDGGQTGATVLQQAFGERPQRVVHALPLARDEAQALADAAFRRQARRFVSGSAVVTGDARLRVGVAVDLAGAGPMYEGTYTITRVRHLFDQESGWTTAIELERPEVSAP